MKSPQEIKLRSSETEIKSRPVREALSQSGNAVLLHSWFPAGAARRK